MLVDAHLPPGKILETQTLLSNSSLRQTTFHRHAWQLPIEIDPISLEGVEGPLILIGDRAGDLQSNWYPGGFEGTESYFVGGFVAVLDDGDAGVAVEGVGWGEVWRRGA